jgi:hypothetical protein
LTEEGFAECRLDRATSNTADESIHEFSCPTAAIQSNALTEADRYAFEVEAQSSMELLGYA